MPIKSGSTRPLTVIILPMSLLESIPNSIVTSPNHNKNLLYFSSYSYINVRLVDGKKIYCDSNNYDNVCSKNYSYVNVWEKYFLSICSYPHYTIEKYLGLFSIKSLEHMHLKERVRPISTGSGEFTKIKKVHIIRFSKTHLI